MIFRFPKDDRQYKWTQHIKDKMLFYRISEQKIKTILKNPDRHEEGIAPNTSAAMKRNDTPRRKEEIWVMYAKNVRDVGNVRNDRDGRDAGDDGSDRGAGQSASGPPARRGLWPGGRRSIVDPRASSKRIMISAWRYPGKTKPGKEIPIPEDIVEQIKKEWF